MSCGQSASSVSDNRSGQIIAGEEVSSKEGGAGRIGSTQKEEGTMEILGCHL